MARFTSSVGDFTPDPDNLRWQNTPEPPPKTAASFGSSAAKRGSNWSGGPAGVQARNPGGFGAGLYGDIKNGLKAGLPPLDSARGMSAARGLGGALAVVPEAISTYNDVTTPGMATSDKIGRVVEGGTRVGGALLGAEGGAALGSMAGPIGTVLGGVAGGTLGFYSPEVVNKVSRLVSGHDTVPIYSDRANELRGAARPLQPGNALSNGATVGQESDFPPIDFSNPSINTKVEAPKGGPAEYSRNDAGAIVRGGTHVVPEYVAPVNDSNPLAAETAARLARANQGMGMQPAQEYNAPDYSGAIADLTDAALSGPNGSMTPGQFAGARHRQQAATQALNTVAGMQNSAGNNVVQMAGHNATSRLGMAQLESTNAAEALRARHMAATEDFQQQQLAHEQAKNELLAKHQGLLDQIAQGTALTTKANTDATNNAKTAQIAAYKAGQNDKWWGADSPAKQKAVEATIQASPLSIAEDPKKKYAASLSEF